LHYSWRNVKISPSHRDNGDWVPTSAGVDLIGTSAAINELKAEVARVARSDAKVLITGESGAGKEVVAKAIYSASARRNAAFVPVNCAGIPESLLESELFGHLKGSFTGAHRDRPGKLELARNGTVFLDEIGEMTLRMQSMLLRFLETGELQKVGSERMTLAANVRVLAATNRNLRELITQGQFREDLFYRINVIHIVVPPLRDRREDIPLLIEHFLTTLKRAAEQNPSASADGSGILYVRGITRDAMNVLCEYSWPGNVRQLQNVIERIVVTGRSEVVQVEDLPLELRTQTSAGIRPRGERRRAVTDVLYKKLVEDRESFWTAVYPLYMTREITRANVRDIVHRGLEEARGNYKIVAKLFNLEERDYKRFLNFLRKHDCQLPFKEYRQ
jgi:transcriptional regulator with PAS, ATPase and Fis domain